MNIINIMNYMVMIYSIQCLTTMNTAIFYIYNINIKMIESKIQKKITDFLKKEWYEVIKITSSNKNGIPDLLALTGNSKHLWIEVKVEKGKLSELQKYVIKWLEQLWDIVLVPYGYEDFIKQYNQLDKTSL